MKKRTILIITLLLCITLSGCMGNQKPDEQAGETELAAGWVEEDGKQFHYQQGSPDIGWYREGDDVYYLNPEDGGAAVEGWIETPEGTYFLENKRLYSGWAMADGAERFFDEDGRLGTGWKEVDGQRYFLGEDGTVHTGWVDDNGNRSYIREDGAIALGWLEVDGKTYYCDDNGIMARGTVNIDGQNYFFTSTGEQVLMVNRWNPVPEGYEVDLQNTHLGVFMDSSCVEPMQRMMADCRAAGCSPQIISGYRSYWDQVAIFREHLKDIGDYATTITIAAIPGTSEHQLGLAADIVDSSYKGLTKGQKDTKVQKWLMEHCWDYGFILRYTEDSSDFTGIIFEPWHYRYVGVELAQELKELGICLEEYLDNLTADGTSCGGLNREEEK